MALEVDAIYENGRFRLLQPINLKEGEIVVIEITPKRDSSQTLDGLLAVEPSDDDAVEIDENVGPIFVDWGDGPTASEMIIQERD